MSGVFQDIELEWNDRIYTIKSNRVMGAIYRIEDIITLQEFQEYALKGTAPIGKLCGAYGAVLRYAGAPIKDEDVYDLMFRGDNAQEAILEAVLNLISLMLPMHAREKLDALQNDGELENANSGNSPATAADSSRQPTKRRSQKRNG